MNNEFLKIFFNYTGENGVDGRGGLGGKFCFDGYFVLGQAYTDWYFWTVVEMFHLSSKAETSTKWPGRFHPNGLKGIEGENKEEIEEPEPAEFVDASYIINHYKSYVRENLPNNIQESKLRKFMKDFEMDKRILDLYDSLSLFDELKSMDDQYLKLRHDLDFMPFYELLLNRTRDYSNTHNESPDHTKLLRFIHTAVSGKISNLRHFRQHVLIIDLLEYLELMQKYIARMQETEREINIDEQKKQYEKALMDKIDSALAIVESGVMPALVQNFNIIMQRIPQLLEKILKKKKEAEEALSELKSDIMWFKMISAIRICGKFAEFFGAAGKGVSLAIKIGISAGEITRKALKRLLNSLEQSKTALLDFLKEKFKMYLKQLKDIVIKIKWLGSAYDETKKYVSECIERIRKTLKTHDVQDVIRVYVIEEMRKEVDRLLGKALEQFQQQCRLSDESKNKTFLDSNDKSTPTLTITAVERSATVKNATAAKNVNQILDITSKIFDDIKDTFDKLEEFAKKEKELEAEIAKWKQRLDDIIYTLIPTIIKMQETISKMVNSLQNNTQFELDIAGWKVQTAIGDIKLLFREMTEGTPFTDRFIRDAEKIEETFGILVKIYDRIQSYLEQAKFAAYIADINSPNSVDITNPEIRRLVLQMRLQLQTNIVMDQYDIAIHSFKQHLFPFAHIHLETFDLPTGLQSNDTKTIVRRAVEGISYLQDQTKFLAISIGKFDQEVFGNIDFNGDNNTIAAPFYTFKSRDYKNDFRRLLSGDEIMIKADIRNALNLNAVKFNEIGIHLKLIDSTIQSEFNAVLKEFGVRMAMVSHNYYRCGNNFYYLSVDDTCVIEYSFRRNQDGKPTKFNDVYRKLSGKNFFLSPYATWKIKLIDIFADFELKNQSVQSTSSAFDKLKKYKNENINLEILGRGQYFRAEGIYANEVCDEKVASYYELDKTIIDSNVVRTKRIYSL